MYRKYSRKGPKVLPIANTSTVLITLFLFLKFTNIMCCCVAIYFLCKFWSKQNYWYKDTESIFSFGIISLCLLFAIMLVVPKTLKLNFQNSSGNEVQFHNLVLLNDDNDGIIIDKVELSDIYSKLYVSMNEKYMNGNLKLYIIDNKGKQHGCSYYLNKITESNGYYQKSYHIQGISSAEQLCQLKIEYYPNSFDEETTECVVNLR